MLLFIHGLEDETYSVSDVETLYAALTPSYKQAHQSERLSIRIFEHLGHQLDLEAAKQSPDLQQDIGDLQQAVATWFTQHLTHVSAKITGSEQLPSLADG